MPDNLLATLKAKVRPLFLVVVVLPTVLAILYFGVLASDVYISESRFVVRMPEKPASSDFGLLLRTTGFSNSNDEINVAQSVVISRDALHWLSIDNAFAKSYTAPGISLFDRYDALSDGGAFEDLYRYFKKKVMLEHESGTSISILTVRAYNPGDAYRFNQKLLALAEATVNRLNDRGQQDMIQFAQREVNDAKTAAERAAGGLAAYRNQSGIVDPEKQATIQLTMISKVQDQLIAAQNQIAAIKTFAPLNPQLSMLQRRARDLQAVIAEQNAQVAGNTRSLAATQANYQQLLLDSQIADKQLGTALASLESARDESRRKQAYVETIVQPNLPDAPLEPRRWRGVLSVLIAGLVAYGVISMLLAGLREHRN